MPEAKESINPMYTKFMPVHIVPVDNIYGEVYFIK